MKKQILYISALLVLILSSCTSTYNPGLNIKTIAEDTVATESEYDILMRFIPNAGDYINSKAVPSMVSAEDVNENLNQYFVIDLRSESKYAEGHISGAVNVIPSELLDYLDENVAASTYDKIILACTSGQTASYVTGVLRLIGYSNAYAMKYGMGSWNKTFDKWSSNVSNKYANQLETKDNPKAKKSASPLLETGHTCGAEILESRARTLLNTPFKKLMIKADRAFTDDSFYIMNYWPASKYEKGHIPGSVQYTPKKDLKAEKFLNTIPSDKKVLVYCFTGQHSAFTVAYLRMLGYNAYTLGFGANSFMHSTLVSKEGWHGFEASKKLHEFPLITGANPTDRAFENASGNAAVASNKPAPVKAKKKVVKRKKKEVEGGCG